MSIKGFEVGGVQQQYDYTALDNIPANLVQDANYVHTDNNYTNADKTKLSGIEAQANKTTIDATLTHSGQAADAKATGDEIVDLKSALNTKAGILRDTVSGSVASFVPDSTVPNLLGLSVALEPIQDLNGYDNPWPAGGGVNKLIECVPGTYTGTYCQAVVSADGTITVSGTTGDSSDTINIPLKAKITTPSEQFYLHMFNTVNVNIAPSFELSTDIAGTTINLACSPANRIYTVPTNRLGVEIDRVRFWIGANKDAALTIHPMFALTNSVVPWTPYSNICPISGHTDADVTRTGKNLLDDGYSDNVTNTVVLPNGTYYAQAWLIESPSQHTTNPQVLINGTWQTVTPTVSLSGISISGTSFGWLWSNAMQTITVTGGPIAIRYNRNDSAIATRRLSLSPVQLTEFSEYVGTTYSITFPSSAGTVYGGTLDVTPGKLTVTKAIVDMGTLSYTYQSLSGGRNSFYAAISGIVPHVSNNIAISAISSMYKAVSWSESWTNGVMSYSRDVNGSGNKHEVTFINNAYTDANTFKSAMSGQTIVYPLATPIVYDLTPTEVSTLLGTNNVWSDTGDVTVEFAADLKTYIDNKIAAAVAAMS